MIEVYRKELDIVFEHAQREYPKECCGVLLGYKDMGRIVQVFSVNNADVADRQKLHYLIHPLELYRIECEAAKNDLEVIGFYHSHTDYPAVLSKEDMQTMVPNILYLIISVVQGKCIEMGDLQSEFCAYRR